MVLTSVQILSWWKISLITQHGAFVFGKKGILVQNQDYYDAFQLLNNLKERQNMQVPSSPYLGYSGIPSVFPFMKGHLIDLALHVSHLCDR